MDPGLKQSLEPFADPVQKSSNDSYAKAKKNLDPHPFLVATAHTMYGRYRYGVNRYRFNTEDIGTSFSDPHHVVRI